MVDGKKDIRPDLGGGIHPLVEGDLAVIGAGEAHRGPQLLQTILQRLGHRQVQLSFGGAALSRHPHGPWVATAVAGVQHHRHAGKGLPEGIAALRGRLQVEHGFPILVVEIISPQLPCRLQAQGDAGPCLCLFGGSGADEAVGQPGQLPGSGLPAVQDQGIFGAGGGDSGGPLPQGDGKAAILSQAGGYLFYLHGELRGSLQHLDHRPHGGGACQDIAASPQLVGQGDNPAAAGAHRLLHIGSGSRL